MLGDCQRVYDTLESVTRGPADETRPEGRSAAGQQNDAVKAELLHLLEECFLPNQVHRQLVRDLVQSRE